MARKPKVKARAKGMGSLTLRGHKWEARWIVDGKIYTRTTGTDDKGIAEQKLKQFTAPFRLGSEVETLEGIAVKIGRRKAEIAKIEDEKPSITFNEGWQTYLDQHNRPDTGESTLEVYRLQYEAFTKWFNETHPKKVDSDGKPIAWELRQVTQYDAERYAGYLLKKLSASTFNRHVNLLALVWRVLEKSARLNSNPWKSIEHKHFAVHSRRELTIEELCRVCEAAKGEMRVLLALGIYCGLRLGDAACLDWSNVDLLKGIISLIPAKTARRSQKRITLPIHRTLYHMLAEIPENKRHGPVMPSLAARYNSFDGALAKDVARLFLDCDIKTGANALTRSEREAIAKAKSDGKELPKIEHSGKRASADCGFHSLRHTFVSLCAAGGVPQSVVQSLVGHGSPAMTQHYTHIGIETAQKAVALLPDVTKEPEQVNAPPETGPEAPAQLDVAALLKALNGMTAKTWRADRDKLVESLVKPAPEGSVG